MWVMNDIVRHLSRSLDYEGYLKSSVALLKEEFPNTTQSQPFELI